MKVSKILLSAIIIAILLCSCSSQAGQKDSLNEKIEIYDLPNSDGATIIHHYGPITQTPSGLFYCKQKNSKFSHKAEYYFYDFATQNESLLMSLNNWIYEVSYDSVLVNNCLYVIIVTGKSVTNQDLELNLYKIDLLNTDIELIYKDRTPTPYLSMAALNDKLIISVPGPEECKIIEVDAETHSNKNVLNYYFDKTQQQGETIRKIFSYNNVLYMLRLTLKMGSETKARLYVDTLDDTYSTSNSIEITEQLLTAAGPEVDEIRQLVSKFFYINDSIYYENFSMTRFLGDFAKSSVSPIISTNALFSMSSDISPNNEMLFYQSYTKDKTVYLFWPDSKKVEISSLDSGDKDYYITYVTKCNENIIVYEYYKDETTGDVYPPKAYFINISDIEWN